MDNNIEIEVLEADDVAEFVIPKSLEKKDWLMCPKCGLPQFLFRGCCLDPNCEPHVFRVDWGCIHCGSSLDPDANLLDSDAQEPPLWMQRLQERALRQYDNAD